VVRHRHRRDCVGVSIAAVLAVVTVDQLLDLSLLFTTDV
jgi:hypothetical protein